MTANLYAQTPPKQHTEASTSAELFMLTLTGGSSAQKNALGTLFQSWKPEYNTLAIETLRFTRGKARQELFHALERHSGQTFNGSWEAALHWLWSQPEVTNADHALLKSRIYQGIDKKFARYFYPPRKSLIRLDEILWGGVIQDGIPPLRSPKMIQTSKANYLADSDSVFGIEINGDIRAYPKRILAWHEMFVDVVGDVPVAGVYCTLCGTVILYETEVEGVNHEIGTSGFLYRSNKLMYDRATQSLWSTMQGEPVVGPLVGKGITFPRRSVVTTTWGEWKRRHPKSKVLSLDTGHQRDYGEGIAYQSYFATDLLMFPILTQDNRLKNKAEVLGLLFPQARHKPLAIEADYLVQNPVYSYSWGDQAFVILTDTTGANRVYEINDGIEFKSWDQKTTVTDTTGSDWQLTEDKLTSSEGKVLKRLPAHRAFWFGWHAAYPNTELIASIDK